MIPNKFAYFSHGSTYRTNKEGENISDNSIVFVEDDQSIATRGKIFGVRGVYPGTCTTAAGTAAKVATTSPLFPLDSSGKPLPGTTIAIKFSNTNSYKTAGTTMTLNVNSTGAYPIYYNNAEVVSTTSANTIACGYKNRYTYYIFNGTQWVWLSYGNGANTTYSNVALGQGYAIQNNESESDTVTATLSSYALTTGGIVVVKFIFDVPGVSDPTLNINAKGAKAIYYNGSPLEPGIIRSGDLATFIYSTNYYLISLDRDFNDPVNVGTLNTNNSTAQTVNSSESFSGTINLHKVSKTGSYNDLLNKPTIVQSVSINGGSAISPTNGNVDLSSIVTGIYWRQQGIPPINGIVTIPDNIVYGMLDNGLWYPGSYDTETGNWIYSEYGLATGELGKIYVNVALDNEVETYIWTGTKFEEVISTSDYATESYVTNAINALPTPMVFQGTIGTEGTSTTVPSNPTEGDTYKIISGGQSLTFSGIMGTIRIGDTVIYKNSTVGWVLIPSGDDPSGTVTSVNMTVPTGLSVSGTPITSSGTLAVSFAAGYSIPTTAKQASWDQKQNAIEIIDLT